MRERIYKAPNGIEITQEEYVSILRQWRSGVSVHSISAVLADNRKLKIQEACEVVEWSIYHCLMLDKHYRCQL